MHIYHKNEDGVIDMAEQSGNAKAIKALADWCEKHGIALNAKVILICDYIEGDPIGVDCCRKSAIRELREIADHL